LLKENNELERQIQNKDNKSVLTDITVYIRSANISPYYQEKVCQDIWKMIADGEKRGETAKDIIGDDYKLFCDNVIAEIPKLSSKEYALSLLRDVLLSADVLLVIWSIFHLMEQIISVNTSPYFTITTGNIICAILSITSAFLVFHIISKNTFNIDKISDKKVFFTLFVLLLICTCANTFIEYPVFQIHAFVAVGGIAVLFVIYKILDTKLD